MQLKTAIDLQTLSDNLENLNPGSEISVGVGDLIILIRRIDDLETTVADMRKSVLDLSLKLSLVE